MEILQMIKNNNVNCIENDVLQMCENYLKRSFLNKKDLFCINNY